jgi:hypothetical protein
MVVNSLSLSNQSVQVSIDRLRETIMQLLSESLDGEDREIETEVVFDLVRDRYLLLGQGWRGQERVYGVWMHLEVREGLVWIQRNQTEVDLVDELVRLGVPEGAIVVGLIPPSYRSLLGSSA